MQVSTDQHAAAMFRSGVPPRHLVATPLVTLPPPRARDLPPWKSRPTALFFGGQAAIVSVAIVSIAIVSARTGERRAYPPNPNPNPNPNPSPNPNPNPNPSPKP